MYSFHHGNIYENTWNYDGAAQVRTSSKDWMVDASYSSRGEPMRISGCNLHSGQASGRASKGCLKIAPKANWFSISTSVSYQGNVEVVNAIKRNPDIGSDGIGHTVTHQEQVDCWPGWAAFSDIVVPHTPDGPFKRNVFLGNIYIDRL